MIGEIITLGLFLTGLGLCIFTGVPILYALVFGLACFSVYTLLKGILSGRPAACSLREWER